MGRKLYVLMGCPGSGKSYFAASHVRHDQIIVSRDEVRFSMLEDGDEYFSKEVEVFKEFIRQIENNLKEDKDVFVDATHLNKTSRAKLLRAINPNLYSEVSVIWIKTPLDECLKRNELRKGTKSYVPRDQVEKMFYNTQSPELEEGFDSIFIKDFNENEAIIKIIRGDEY